LVVAGVATVGAANADDAPRAVAGPARSNANAMDRYFKKLSYCRGVKFRF
jgi:hypothetical protein